MWSQEAQHNLRKQSAWVLTGAGDPTQDREMERQKTDRVIVRIKDGLLAEPFHLKN